MINKATAARQLAEKIKLDKYKLNIHEQIDRNRIDIKEDFLKTSEGRAIDGRIDVSINGESMGYWFWGTERNNDGRRSFSSRPNAFNAIKDWLKTQLIYHID